jgi:type II secretory pathway component PulF
LPAFEYTAKKNSDEIVKNIITADNQDAVAKKLISLNLYPISIKRLRNKYFGFEKKISPKELSILLMSFADMIDAGMSLVDSLKSIERQTKNLKIKEMIGNAKSMVMDGKSLSDSLQSYPEIFDETICSILRIGENSGNLSAVLRETSNIKWMEYEIKAKILSISFYPILLICFGTVVVFTLLTYAFPKITAIYANMGQSLPMLTSFVLSISRFLNKYWYLVIIFLILGFQLCRFAGKRYISRRKIDKILLEMPLLSILLKKIELRKFAKLFSIMLQNGVSISDSLMYIRGSISNSVIRAEVDKAREEIISGKSVSAAFAEKDVFPDIMMQSFQMGETGRNMGNTMRKIADIFERDLDTALKNFSVIAEPLLILLVGAVIGLLVLAVLLPIFNINLTI